MRAPDHRPGFHCTACQAYHAPPKCEHDADASCLDCNKPRNWRWNLPDGSLAKPAWRCWWCASGTPRPVYRGDRVRRVVDLEGELG